MSWSESIHKRSLHPQIAQGGFWKTDNKNQFSVLEAHIILEACTVYLAQLSLLLLLLKCLPFLIVYFSIDGVSGC